MLGVLFFVEGNAKPRKPLGDARTDSGRILADSGREHESIDAAQSGRKHAGTEPHPVFEIPHRKSRTRIVTRLQLSQLRATYLIYCLHTSRGPVMKQRSE